MATRPGVEQRLLTVGLGSGGVCVGVYVVFVVPFRSLLDPLPGYLGDPFRATLGTTFGSRFGSLLDPARDRAGIADGPQTLLYATGLAGAL